MLFPMCYSSQIHAAYKSYLRFGGAYIDVHQFASLYGFRYEELGSVRIPRVVDAWFAQPQTDDERQLRALIDKAQAAEVADWEGKIAAQRDRLEKAEAKLATKPTKAAANDKRIAESKIDHFMRKIARAREDILRASDARIWPMDYAPILIHDKDKGPVIRLARYHLRRAHDKPESDLEKPGRYNARRDNLTRYWREQFGQKHAIMIWDRFYESVPTPDQRRREIQFEPQDKSLMYVACIWDEWRDPADPTKVLLSCAAVTDDPPSEVQAAGHDRCPVNLTAEAALKWLQPVGMSDAELFALMDEGRQRPFYEHRDAREAEAA